jgi:hypothetical protein
MLYWVHITLKIDEINDLISALVLLRPMCRGPKLGQSWPKFPQNLVEGQHIQPAQKVEGPVSIWIGSHQDLDDQFGSVTWMILDWEVEQPFGEKVGVCAIPPLLQDQSSLQFTPLSKM